MGVSGYMMVLSCLRVILMVNHIDSALRGLVCCQGLA